MNATSYRNAAMHNPIDIITFNDGSQQNKWEVKSIVDIFKSMAVKDEECYSNDGRQYHKLYPSTLPCLYRASKLDSYKIPKIVLIELQGRNFVGSDGKVFPHIAKIVLKYCTTSNLLDITILPVESRN
ncbi:MAG: hypothetical protein S4CHLAM20_07030 [Chlamydiia bacterium]|nr:hypothetical protein [Chlamydiia bacterium]